MDRNIKLMSIFAILKEAVVENTVVFDTSKLDELRVIFQAPTYEIIEVTEENAPAGISVGDAVFNGKFRRQKPYLSWTFNEDFWRWEAPQPYPKDGIAYVWDEDTMGWSPVSN